MNIQTIQIDETPQLFADFLKKSASLEAFFPHLQEVPWEAVLATRRNLAVSRERLAEVLSGQLRAWQAPAASLENAARLGDEHTVAVVTGQQAGVLGGPLYTFYKTLTVLRLCRELAEKYPAFNFVPVFWLEINDSDFKEIAQLRYQAKDGSVKHLALPEAEADQGKPVAVRQIDPALQSWRQAFEEDFVDSEFKAEVLDDLFYHYAPGQTYGAAFARLLLRFFGQQGLVVADPSDPGLLALAQPFFRRAVEEAETLRDLCEERSSALAAAGYSPQIQFLPDQSLLFYTAAEGRRYRLDIADEQSFSYKSPQGVVKLRREALMAEISDRPEAISPNVALRPLLQDFLLPTAAYVGGPSEVAYFSQLSGLYDYFDLGMPALIPRHRITLAEPKVQRNLAKLGLEYADVFTHRSGLVEAYLKTSAGQQIFQATREAQSAIEEELQKLESLLEKVDPTLISTLQKTRQNVTGSFGKLGGKIQKSVEARNQTQVRQIEAILGSVFPEGNFQERVLNFAGFAVKYGPGLFEELLQLLPADSSPHYIVEL